MGVKGPKTFFSEMQTSVKATGSLHIINSPLTFMFLSESHREEASAPGTESQQNIKLHTLEWSRTLTVPPGAFA